jgi:hypothetical protein
MCRLCGDFGHLTVTHVPAKSAGNVGPTQRAMVEIASDGKKTYALGGARGNGMSGRWFCRPCNTDRTRPWDEEYTRWVPQVFNALHDPSSTGNTIALEPADLDRGAFARCLWAWFFATVAGLRERVPEIAAAVISGEPVARGGYPRVFLAATRELQFSMQILPSSAVITAPPYVALLANFQTEWHTLGWLNTAAWLAERPGRREAARFALPIIETLGDEPMPMLGEPVLD